MSAPLSLARILAALKRISPPWPSTDVDKSVGKELGSIATAIGMAADVVDIALDEVFPDTTTQLIERWEKVTRVPTRTSDDLPTRRAKVMSVLRRLSGARLDQLEKMLTAPLATDPSNMIWVEPLREFIDEALTETTGAVSLAVPSSPPGLTVSLGKPWPGVVDDWGVHVYIAINVPGTVTVKSPLGTSWVFTLTGTADSYFTRTVFTGQSAAGLWTINIVGDIPGTLTEARLMVSNNVDAGQIYYFYVLRDPTLPGTADLVEAQRLFHRTALGNMRAFVIETLAFAVDDPHSLVDRDPVGV